MDKNPNILGDIRAESDQKMLDQGFYETSDYHTLVASTERPVVVGRRGTGKTALSYHLKKYYEQEEKQRVIHIILKKTK